MLTLATGIAEDADISAIVFWPDAIVLRCPRLRNGQHLACHERSRGADISAPLLRPYHILLLSRHLGSPRPSQGRDTNHAHITAILCGPQSLEPLHLLAGPSVVMKRPNIPTIVYHKTVLVPLRNVGYIVLRLSRNYITSCRVFSTLSFTIYSVFFSRLSDSSMIIDA